MDAEARRLREALRRRGRAARRALTPDQRAAAAARITERVVGVIRRFDAGCVALYASVGAEVSTAGLHELLHRRGVTVVYPVVPTEPGSMDFAEVASPHELHSGRLGVRVPAASAPLVPPNRLDVAIVPVVAYDRAATRLGQGGGYYDRTLPLLDCPSFGIAFAAQEVTDIPVAPWDAPLTGIITEEGSISR